MTFGLHPYSLGLRSPLATAHRIVEEREGALVSYRDDGITGWGDVCPMPGWSTHGLSRLVDELERAIAEHEDPSELSTRLFGYREASAAVVGSALDVEAQRRGVPLATALTMEPYVDTTPLERIRVNATIGAADVGTALTSANLAVASGITTLKLKVAHRSLDADVALVEGTRRSVGDEVEIRLDANGGWRPDEALEALERLAPFDISFCEEPTAGIEAIAAVGEASPIPVAVDESARTVDEIDHAVATGSIPFVVVKPQAIGGALLALRAIARATQAGVTPVVTSMIDSAVGVAHAVHVAAASGVDVAHGLATSALLAADVAAPLPVQDGHITVPSGPGLGVRPAVAGR